MAKPKAKSLQQKLGFFDDDLRNPTHDEILLWVDRNIGKLISSIYKMDDWDIEKVMGMRKNAVQIAKVELEKSERVLSEKQIALQNALEKKSKYELEYEEKAIGQYREEIGLLENKINYLKAFNGLPDDLPQRQKPEVIRKEWEYTVTNRSCNPRTGYKSSKSVIGFIDMRVDFHYTRLFVDGLYTKREEISHRLRWGQSGKKNYYEPDKLEKVMLIEVKTKIPSLGELFRQLNTYKEYVSGDYIVVCPDDSNRDIIEEQGFRFFKYEG